MKSRSLLFLYHFLFWILFAWVERGIFMVYNHSLFEDFSFSALVQIFMHGCIMDISMASYVSVIPGLWLSISFLHHNKKIDRKFFIVYVAILLAIQSILLIIDLPLYQAWRFRLDTTFLKYLTHPKESLASTGSSPVFLLLFIGLSLYLFFYFLFKKIMSFYPSSTSGYPYSKRIALFILGLVFTGALIIPIRGGLQLAPMNPSRVYFSNHLFYNHAALNVSWNFLYSVVAYKNPDINPNNYLSNEEATTIVDSLCKKDTSALKILRDSIQPNVLIITWESFTYKALALGGMDSTVTPNMNALIHEGVFFSNLYASGDRTDKGIVAVLSGYPAQSTTSIVKSANKAHTLPMLSKTLANEGYNTSFYYGGELEFANMKSYILGGRFEKITTKDQFSATECNSKWGAFDHIVFGKIQQDLKTIKSPFFVQYLTLTSHEPFEVPENYSIPYTAKGKSETELFLRSLSYTDACLGAFIKEAKKQDWWKNTLIVFLSDHGHVLPTSPNRSDDFHMPMLWLGGALNNPLLVPKVCSQIDLASTLLAQLNISHTEFYWSKDIFANTPSYAYFAFNNGFGWVNDQKDYYIFDHVGKNVVQSSLTPSAPQLQQGKAYAQKSFQDYLDR